MVQPCITRRFVGRSVSVRTSHTYPRDLCDADAGYRGGTVTTAPVLISTSQLRVSVAGGNDGVQVGVKLLAKFRSGCSLTVYCKL